MKRSSFAMFLTLVFIAQVRASSDTAAVVAPDSVVKDAVASVDTAQAPSEAAPKVEDAEAAMGMVEPEADVAPDSVVKDPVSAVDTVQVPPEAAPKAEDAEAAVDSVEPGDGILRAQVVRLRVRGVPHREETAQRRVMTGADVRATPAAMGDPVRSLASLPGVETTSDLSAAPIVRGGHPEHVRVFLDGIPLLQPFHFLSTFSVFNPRMVESMELHMASYPARGQGSLSGALEVHTMPAPLDSFDGGFDVSLLRGAGQIGVPLVPGWVGLRVGSQSLWYFTVIEGVRWLIKEAMQTQKKGPSASTRVVLPQFMDVQAEVRHRMGSIEPRWTFMWNRDLTWADQRRSFSQTVIEDGVNREYNLEIREKNFEVNIEGLLGAVQIPWTIDDRTDLEARLWTQSTGWTTNFPYPSQWQLDTARNWVRVWDPDGSLDERYRRDRLGMGGSVGITRRLGERLSTSAGVNVERRTETWDARINRPSVEFLVHGNRNDAELLGFFEPGGFVLREGDLGARIPEWSGGWSADVFASRLSFDHRGGDTAWLLGVWQDAVWDHSDDLRLRAGLRVESESWSGSVLPQPRLSAHWRAPGGDVLTASLGLVSQNDHSFDRRETDPGLPPERSSQIGLEWMRPLDRSIRVQVQGWARRNTHLASPRWVVGPIDWERGPLQANPWPGRRATEEESELLDTFYNAPLEQAQAMYAMATPREHGLLDSVYGTSGLRWDPVGEQRGAGLELSVSFAPVTGWRGWVSLEGMHLRRRDRPGDPWLPDARERRWSWEMVHLFDLPGSRSLGVRWASRDGVPYTRWDQDPGGDTLMIVEPRNEGRYMPFHRLDIRLESSRRLGRVGMLRTYFEIWNALNDPNFLLRDSRTRQTRLIESNFPYPLLFWGADLEF